MKILDTRVRQPNARRAVASLRSCETAWLEKVLLRMYSTESVSRTKTGLPIVGFDFGDAIPEYWSIHPLCLKAPLTSCASWGVSSHALNAENVIALRSNGSHFKKSASDEL